MLAKVGGVNFLNVIHHHFKSLDRQSNSNFSIKIDMKFQAHSTLKRVDTALEKGNEQGDLSGFLRVSE